MLTSLANKLVSEKIVSCSRNEFFRSAHETSFTKRVLGPCSRNECSRNECSRNEFLSAAHETSAHETSFWSVLTKRVSRNEFFASAHETSAHETSAHETSFWALLTKRVLTKRVLTKRVQNSWANKLERFNWQCFLFWFSEPLTGVLYSSVLRSRV